MPAAKASCRITGVIETATTNAITKMRIWLWKRSIIEDMTLPVSVADSAAASMACGTEAAVSGCARVRVMFVVGGVLYLDTGSRQRALPQAA